MQQKNFNDVILTECSGNSILLVGIPYDANSSFMMGSAEAPTEIRAVMNNGSSNFYAESGSFLGDGSRFVDAGDLHFDDSEDPFSLILESVSHIYARGMKSIFLGGDHSISYPVVKGIREHVENFCILHLDAHSDTYRIFEGNPYSHACPFARIMEEKLTDRLIQVGIRTLNPEQKEQIERFRIEVYEMRNWSEGTEIKLQQPVYLSVDLDVLDPAYAPGVSHHEPGGMSTRQVIQIIQNIKVPIIGADIVEYNPRRDHAGVTAAVAAKLVKDIYAKMAEV